MVDVLSKEIGYRGVTVNSIIPFAVDHSGIFTEAHSYPELRKSLIDSCPMRRSQSMSHKNQLETSLADY